MQKIIKNNQKMAEILNIQYKMHKKINKLSVTLTTRILLICLRFNVIMYVHYNITTKVEKMTAKEEREYGETIYIGN